MKARLRRWHAWCEWASWQLRYWVLDKHHERLRGGAFALSLLIWASAFGSLCVGSYARVQNAMPVVHAGFWVQIIIMIVSALISYALRPKPQEPKPQERKAPVVEDGARILRHYGTCWSEDAIQLAWKPLKEIKIKAKGGKK